MDVGVGIMFQNFADQVGDKEVWERDLAIASEAEPMGFDFLNAVEHHFDGYSMSPDNVSFLSYIAAKTSRIRLMTGAVILPWNNPLRVTEKIIALDHMSKGRVMFGMGRGLARREYDAFGIDMGESRERFDEAAEVILRGLETGIVEGNGKHYPQKSTRVRPGPYASFKDRLYGIATSSDSVPSCARLGATMMCFAVKPWEEMATQVATYRNLFRQAHNKDAPPVLFANCMVCDESADRAQELAEKYIGNYFDSVMEHYDLVGEHFKKTKGYGEYATIAEFMRSTPYEMQKAGYIMVNDHGTPAQLIEEYARRRELLGDYQLLVIGSMGNMPKEDVLKSLKLFSEKVLPELQSWKQRAA